MDVQFFVQVRGGAVMYRQLVALTLLTLILGFTVTGYAQEKPPLSSTRITGEFLAGVTGGAVAVIIMYYWFDKFFPEGDGRMGLILYFPVGYVIGSATGVYLAGNIGNETGSFLLPLVSGSLAGLVATVATLSWCEDWIIPAILVSVPAVATIGFNLTRRYK